MAASRIIMQSADGASVGLTIPDGLTSGERQVALGANLSGVTAYHLLQGNLSATVLANYIEVSSTTTRNYTTSDYIFDSTNYKLYDCIMASTAGTLLTNTTYFTSITAGTLSINNALIPLAQGIDGNGAKNTILSKNETITGLTYTQGKNYVYCDKNGSYGVKPHRPRYLSTDLVRTYAGESPDYYDVVSNKWFNCDAGAELVTNGKFDSGVTTGWTTTTGFTISVQNSSLKMDRNIVTPTGGVYQNISTVIGKKYKVTLDILYISAGGLSIWIDSGNTLSTYITTTGKQVLEFTANNSLTKLEFLQSGVSQTGTINLDNISVFESDITPTSEITDSRNCLDAIVYADHNGQVEYVEQLPKTQYVDEIKANEFKGKNACTAWANVSSSVILLDNYNFSAVTFKPGNAYKLYFKEPMDNTNYVVVGAQNEIYIDTTTGGGFAVFNKTLTSFEYTCPSNTYNTNNHIIVFGGKN